MRRVSSVRETDRRPQVVLIDDHQIIRRGIREILEESGQFDVVAEASCGYEAIHAAEQFQPDIVLLDYQLPGLTGMMIAPVITRRSPRTRIVFLSAYGDDEHIREARQIGAAAYVTKDQATDELLNVLTMVAAGETAFIESTQRCPGAMPRSAPAPVIQWRHPYSGAEDDFEREPLTAREITVLDCVVQGHRYNTCATNLFISEATVKNNTSSILSKCGLNSRVHLLLYAVMQGWVQISPTHATQAADEYAEPMRQVS